jgi:hypothetical protein
LKYIQYHILFISLFLFGCNSNKRKGEFYGHVKSVKEFTYNSIENESKKDSAFSVWKIYNEKGELIQTNRIDGRLNFKYSYKYDEKGNQIEKEEHDPDTESTLVTKYRYDEKNNQIEENNFLHEAGKEDEPTLKCIFKYDEKGNKINEKQYLQTELVEDIMNKYDNKGNKVEIVYTSYQRNREDGDEEDSDNGEIADTAKADSVNIIGVSKGDNLSSRNDENRNNSNTDTIVYGSSSKVQYTYDDKGNEIEEKEHNSKGKIIRIFTFKYEFDTKNNWTKKIEFLDGRLIEITERELEYY